MQDRAQEQHAEDHGIPAGETSYYSGEHMQLLAQMQAMQGDAQARRN